jgi:hypothetical protein
MPYKIGETKPKIRWEMNILNLNNKTSATRKRMAETCFNSSGALQNVSVTRSVNTNMTTLPEQHWNTNHTTPTTQT